MVWYFVNLMLIGSWLHLFLPSIAFKVIAIFYLIRKEYVCKNLSPISWESKAPIWEPNLVVNWIVQDYLRQIILQLEFWHSHMFNVWIENWRICGLPTIVLPIWIIADHNLENSKQVYCVNSSKFSWGLCRCQTPISKFQYDIHMKMVWYFVNLMPISSWLHVFLPSVAITASIFIFKFV
jgi:hypothetical protein